jgi:signal peptidase II
VHLLIQKSEGLKKSTKVALLVALVLIIDQAVKIWVKTHMSYGEEIKIFGLDWALIHFVENNGMAFGLSFGGEYGKLALSLFRIVAVGFLVYYIRLLIKEGASFGLLACFGLILAGATGNILDSAFYGLIFSESPYHGHQVAQLFPDTGGYAGFLHGKVVDMLYFPMFRGTFPEWFPFWGGERFLFFRPVFNIADSAITVGVFSLVLFHRNFFNGQIQATEASEVAESSPSVEVAQDATSNTTPEDEESKG